MTIEEYARKRQDLRADLCGKVQGHVDFLSNSTPSPTHDRIACAQLLRDVTAYQAAVAALDAEFKGEKV